MRAGKLKQPKPSRPAKKSPSGPDAKEARRQEWHGVVAYFISDHYSFISGGLIDYSDFRAGDHSTILISHDPFDATGRRALCESIRQRQQASQQNQSHVCFREQDSSRFRNTLGAFRVEVAMQSLQDRLVVFPLLL